LVFKYCGPLIGAFRGDDTGTIEAFRNDGHGDDRAFRGDGTNDPRDDRKNHPHPNPLPSRERGKERKGFSPLI